MVCPMMTGERVGVGHDPSRGAAYVEAWVAALKENPREIRRAAADAQKISDFVLVRSRERHAEREPIPVADTRAHAERGGGRTRAGRRAWPESRTAHQVRRPPPTLPTRSRHSHLSDLPEGERQRLLARGDRVRRVRLDGELKSTVARRSESTVKGGHIRPNLAARWPSGACALAAPGRYH